ncbi:type 1 glutamine amidotransferase [Sphingomonas gellani]|nr:type 1 glutamine amidotransferase [Sphingomonas gellani]
MISIPVRTSEPLRFLVAESENHEQREARRARVGRSSGESYCETLRQIAPDAECRRVAPADADADLPDREAIRAYDAVFVTGSPLHVYNDMPETRRQIAFMRDVFESGVPSFGSCAGLQLAVAAAGGTVRSMDRQEAGIARRISPTVAGRDHPLLAGRGPAWDAPAIHGDEVVDLPPGATLLATNAVTRVQAAEIRHAGGIFWGVQYHPELSLAEIAAALRREAGDLVEAGLALTEDAVTHQAEMLDALDLRPDRIDLRWRLGVDAELAETDRRRTELNNFIRHLVIPSRDHADAALAIVAA